METHDRREKKPQRPKLRLVQGVIHGKPVPFTRRRSQVRVLTSRLPADESTDVLLEQLELAYELLKLADMTREQLELADKLLKLCAKLHALDSLSVVPSTEQDQKPDPEPAA
jgi:hypothetical protein